MIIGQSKIIEGRTKIGEKIHELISCYQDLKIKNESLKDLISRLEHELRKKETQFDDLEQKSTNQERIIKELETSLSSYEELQNNNSALRENLDQISLEFQNTKDDLIQKSSQTKMRYDQTKQQVDFVKTKMIKIIRQIDKVLSIDTN